MLPLILLHGALASSAQFEALQPRLPELSLHLLDFEGHGAVPLRDRPLHSQTLADSVVAWLDERAIERANLFGYSLGGYVACLAALGHPGRVGRVATLGTRFPWDAATLQRELRMLDPATMQAKVPHFVEALAREHRAIGWERLVAETQGLLRANAAVGGLTAERLAGLDIPVRVIVGDRDTTAGVAESFAAFQALPQGELEVLPATPHPFPKVEMGRVALSLRAFFGAG